MSRRGERTFPRRAGPAPAPPATGGIVISGDLPGIANIGANAHNTVIQYHVTGTTAEFQPVAELEPREIPLLRTFQEHDPVGRAWLIEQVAGQLASGTSVQLHGPPGVGKKAISACRRRSN